VHFVFALGDIQFYPLQNIFPTRTSKAAAAAAETVGRQPSPPAPVSPVARIVLPPSNLYSQEMLGLLAELQRVNRVERALTVSKWTVH
jgi:hypothetical protein